MKVIVTGSLASHTILVLSYDLSSETKNNDSRASALQQTPKFDGRESL